MAKRNFTYLVGGLLLGTWTIFCIKDLPKLQEAQRNKVYKREMQIQAELKKNSVNTYAPVELSTESTELLETTIIECTKEVCIVQSTMNSNKYTDAELQLLARLIEAEGGTESYQCKLYIGSVVLNRMASDSFPDSLEDVIFQTNKNGMHQFSVTCTRKDGTRPIDCTPSTESLDAAEYLLTNGTQLPLDVVVFYADYCNEGWVTTRAKYTKVDTTVFAYAYSI